MPKATATWHDQTVEARWCQHVSVRPVLGCDIRTHAHARDSLQNKCVEQTGTAGSLQNCSGGGTGMGYGGEGTVVIDDYIRHYWLHSIVEQCISQLVFLRLGSALFVECRVAAGRNLIVVVLTGSWLLFGGPWKYYHHYVYEYYHHYYHYH